MLKRQGSAAERLEMHEQMKLKWNSWNQFWWIFCIKWCSNIRNLNAFYIKNNDPIHSLLVTVKSCNSWGTSNICCFPLVDGGLPVPGDSGGRLSSLETHSAETSVATLKVYYIVYTDIWKYLNLTLSPYVFFFGGIFGSNDAALIKLPM